MPKTNPNDDEAAVTPEDTPRVAHISIRDADGTPIRPHDVRPGDPNCPKCRGMGTVVAKLVVEPHPQSPMQARYPQVLETNCSCKDRRIIDHFLHPRLRRFSGVKGSPYMQWTKRNLYVTAFDEPFYPHLRTALIYEFLLNPNFRYVLISDADLVDIKFERHQEFKSFGELMRYDLVVLRTGRLGHHNQAAPGWALEFMYNREAVAKPTWVQDDTDYPIKEGRSFVWSHDIENFLTGKFTTFHRHIEGEQSRSVRPAGEQPTVVSRTQSTGVSAVRQKDNGFQY